MHILSIDHEFVALTPDATIRWRKGSHTANVWGDNGEVDAFTFSWEKDTTSMLDFTTALQSYLEYRHEAD